MFETALLVGGVFGARHALEADHVAAVVALVDGEAPKTSREHGDTGDGAAAKASRGGADGESSEMPPSDAVDERSHPLSTGVAWGVGHSAPLLVLGGLFLVFDVTLPPAVATVFEVVAAAVLVALGLRVLAGRGSLGALLVRHIHGDRSADGGGTDGDDGHRHLTLGRTSLGFGHSHAADASFTIGIVHGLAGSGGVVVALAAAAPTSAAGAAFLVGFALATVLAMGLAAWGWGRLSVRSDLPRTVAGLASVAVGLLLFAEIAGVVNVL